MFDVKKVELEWAGKNLIIETGKIARQADASVLVTYGGTTVMANVVAAKQAKPDIDFFPLTVDYRELSYAAGVIPGNFFRREARPSEREILTCRLIDRPMRPLFPENFMCETMIQVMVVSYDKVCDCDILAINATSASLHVSDIPFDGPIGAVRVGRIDGQIIVNPTIEQQDESDLNCVLAGTSDAIVITEPTSFTDIGGGANTSAYIGGFNISCNGYNDGTITVQAGGGGRRPAVCPPDAEPRPEARPRCRAQRRRRCRARRRRRCQPWRRRSRLRRRRTSTSTTSWRTIR